MSGGELPADPRQAAGQLLQECYPRLLTRIRWMMGEKAQRLAESGDFAGELTARILAEADGLRWRDREHFLNLATRISRHLVMNSVRRQRIAAFESIATQLSAGKIPAASGVTPSRVAARREHIEQLLGILERLPEDDRVLIESRYFEGRSFRETAARLGCSENAVQLRHARMLTRLRQLLSDSSMA